MLVEGRPSGVDFIRCGRNLGVRGATADIADI
jgi:hypothetical protein